MSHLWALFHEFQTSKYLCIRIFTVIAYPALRVAEAYIPAYMSQRVKVRYTLGKLLIHRVIQRLIH